VYVKQVTEDECEQQTERANNVALYNIYFF